MSFTLPEPPRSINDRNPELYKWMQEVKGKLEKSHVLAAGIPITSPQAGDMAYKAPLAWARLAAGNSGQILTQTGTGTTAKPAWGNISSNIASGTGISVSGTGTVTIALSNPGFLQQVRFLTGTAASGTTVIPVDNTIPQGTEGNQFMSLAITPMNTAGVLVVDIVANHNLSNANNLVGALFRDSGTNAIGVQAKTLASQAEGVVNFRSYVSSSSTALSTFSYRAGLGTAGTTYFNANGTGGSLFGNTLASSIIITEYAT